MNPVVSVVIPTYNRSKLLPRCIKSVLNQTFSDLEIIIVDDGSTDNTSEVVKSLNDKRINYIKLEKNLGANHARNIGIKEAKGKYIAFQDSDDLWLKNKIEVQLRIFEEYKKNNKKDLGLVYSKWVCLNSKTKKLIVPKEFKKFRSGNIFKNLKFGNFIALPTIIIKSDSIKNLKFNENLPRLQDWEFFIRISKDIDVGFTNEPLVIVDFQSNGISNNNKALKNAFLFFIKNYYEYFFENKDLLSYFYFYIALFELENKKIENFYSLLKYAVKINPLSIKTTFRLSRAIFFSIFYIF